jgi:hypothetical protein
MAKYRKKPVVIEAYQYAGDFIENSVWNAPTWIKQALDTGKLKYKELEDNPPELYVVTLEGDMKCDYMDYVIKGVKGELYPCKPDIFEETYEQVDEK